MSPSHKRKGCIITTDENHDRLIPIADVTYIVGRSRASIYRDIKAGTFPRSVKVGQSARWQMPEIQQFVSDP